MNVDEEGAELPPVGVDVPAVTVVAVAAAWFELDEEEDEEDEEDESPSSDSDSDNSSASDSDDAYADDTKGKKKKVKEQFTKLKGNQRSELRKRSKEFQKNDNKYGTTGPTRAPPPHFRTVQAYLRWLVLHPDGAPAVFKSQHMIAFFEQMSFAKFDNFLALFFILFLQFHVKFW